MSMQWRAVRRRVRAGDYGGGGWVRSHHRGSPWVSPPRASTGPQLASRRGNFDQPARDFEQKKTNKRKIPKRKNSVRTHCASAPSRARPFWEGRSGDQADDQPCRKLLRKSLRMAPYNQNECSNHS